MTYLAGGLTSRSLEAVRAHLDDCPSCRRLAAEAAQGDAGPPPDAGARPLRTFAPGDRIAGRYVVRRFVAEGGMGEVYEVTDGLLGDVVALKTLPCTALDSAAAFARMRSEVQLARRVTHPNVCRILEFGVDERPGAGGATPFFTMELLAGETLGGRLAHRGPFAPAEAAAFARQLASGLAAIHETGIVHRDLKSENVFLLPSPGPDGEPFRVVVMDFGLARPTDVGARRSFSQVGAIVGTLAYMAPEQLAGLAATVRSDIYSVGVILFEALTARLPFDERTLLRAEIGPGGDPGAAALSAARLPAGWAPIVRRCLEIEPGKRFGSAAALREALDQAARAAARPRRRRPLLVGGAGLAAVGLGGGALWLAGRDAEQTVVDRRPQPTWGAAEVIETVDTGFSNLPHVAANRAGAAVVVWEQEDRATRRTALWGRTLDPARGFGEATRLEQGEGNVKSAQAAIDGTGRAVAVWLQRQGGRQRAFAARFDPATGWSAAERLDAEASEGVERVRVAAGPGDGVVAVFSERVGTRGRLHARRLLPQGGWSAPEEVSDGGGSAQWPDVAVDGQGRAVVVWVRGTSAGHAVNARRLGPGTGAGAGNDREPAVALEGEGPESTVPLVAVEAGGRAVVVWRRPGEAAVDVWASPYVPGHGWGPAALVEHRDEEAGFARVAVGGGGEAILTWKQAERPRRRGEPPGEMRLWARRFSFARGFGPPVELAAPPAGRIEKPELQMDAEGHALVVWAHERGASGGTDVWAEEYDPRTGWARPRIVETSAERAGSPAGALTRDGHGIVVWPQVHGGEFKILGVRF